jgi:hypothetical protein
LAFDVNDIKAELTYGGARPTLFRVQITNPVDSSADVKVPFMVQATQLPPSRIGKIEVPYFGRKIPLAGDRVFDDWVVSVINDEDFPIRDALETWSNKINAHRRNIRDFATSSPLAYKSTGLVTQFAKTGEELRTYKFSGIFPLEIGPIEMAWDAQDQIEVFQTTFAIDWWEVESGTTGNGGGA